MKELLARKTRQAKALSWAIIHFYSWGRDERQRDVLQLMEPIPLPTHREHRELWMCSGASHHKTPPEREAVPELERCPQQNRKKVLENSSNHGTVSHWGFKPFQLLFQWLWQDSGTGRCHWQQDTPSCFSMGWGMVV